MIRAGYNGYGSEIGGSGYDPVTITTATGNRAGAEFYYGFSSTTGGMRAMRVMIDSQVSTGATTSELYGMDIAVRSNPSDSATSTYISSARGLLVGIYPKGLSSSIGNTITNAVGVQSLIDMTSDKANTITDWRAFDVKIDNHGNGNFTLTDAYGLYFEDSTAGLLDADIRLSSGAAIITNSGAPSSSSASSNTCNTGGDVDFSQGTIYLRSDGSSTTTMYVCTDTDTWTPMTGN